MQFNSEWTGKLRLILKILSGSRIVFWDEWAKDRYLEIRIRRNTFIAVLMSLAVHGIVLFVFAHKKLVGASSVAYSPPTTLNVHLAGLPAKKVLSVALQEAIKPKNPDIKAQPKLPTPRIIAVEKNSPISIPKPARKAPVIPRNDAPADLMSYIKAQRQRSQGVEDSHAREDAAPKANTGGPSADEIRDANIQNNLQQQGTNGIFEIRRKTLRTAQFSFKGWKNNYSNARLEIIDVEAGPDGNIDLAIIKKMIEIIRREYKGDFNWESDRLGRSVVLSARIEDNAALEEFLMQDFLATDAFRPRP